MKPFRFSIRHINKVKRSRGQIDSFYWRYLQHSKPVTWDYPTFSQAYKRHELPVFANWIQQDPERPVRKDKRVLHAPWKLNYEYLEQFGKLRVPLEQTVWADREGKPPWQWEVKSFERFEAPLSEFLAWTKQKLAGPEEFRPNEGLYLAQCNIRNLPKQLSDDLLAPLYTVLSSHGSNMRMEKAPDHTANSSIWMGIPPTETPLHNDPEQNFFIQIAGVKVVRLVSPEDGELLLYHAKKEAAIKEGGRAITMGMRGKEMMSGPERQILSELVWEHPPSWSYEVKTQEQAYMAKKAKIEAQALRKARKEEEADEDEDEDKALYSQLPHEASVPDTIAQEGSDSATSTTPIEAENAKHEAVKQQKARDAEDPRPVISIREIRLDPGDCLYIPRHWYHSIRSLSISPTSATASNSIDSLSAATGINLSANWWFGTSPAKRARKACPQTRPPTPRNPRKIRLGRGKSPRGRGEETFEDTAGTVRAVGSYPLREGVVGGAAPAPSINYHARSQIW